MPRRSANNDSGPSEERRVTRRSLRSAVESPKLEVDQGSRSRSRNTRDSTHSPSPAKQTPQSRGRGRGRGRGSSLGRRKKSVQEEESEEIDEPEDRIEHDEAVKRSRSAGRSGRGGRSNTSTVKVGAEEVEDSEQKAEDVSPSVRGRNRRSARKVDTTSVNETSDVETKSPRRSRSARAGGMLTTPRRRSGRGHSTPGEPEQADEDQPIVNEADHKDKNKTKEPEEQHVSVELKNAPSDQDKNLSGEAQSPDGLVDEHKTRDNVSDSILHEVKPLDKAYSDEKETRGEPSNETSLDKKLSSKAGSDSAKDVGEKGIEKSCPVIKLPEPVIPESASSEKHHETSSKDAHDKSNSENKVEVSSKPEFKVEERGIKRKCDDDIEDPEETKKSKKEIDQNISKKDAKNEDEIEDEMPMKQVEVDMFAVGIDKVSGKKTEINENDKHCTNVDMKDTNDKTGEDVEMTDTTDKSDTNVDIKDTNDLTGTDVDIIDAKDKLGEDVGMKDTNDKQYPEDISIENKHTQFSGDQTATTYISTDNTEKADAPGAVGTESLNTKQSLTPMNTDNNVNNTDISQKFNPDVSKESNLDVPQESSVPECIPSETDKDYVLVSMEDLPDKDSPEVIGALPNVGTRRQDLSSEDVHKLDSASETITKENSQVTSIIQEPLKPEESFKEATEQPSPTVTSAAEQDISNKAETLLIQPENPQLDEGINGGSGSNIIDPSAAAAECSHSDTPSNNVESVNDTGGTVADKLFLRQFIANPNVNISIDEKTNQFSVVSYNILADCHFSKDSYTFASPETVTQEFRHKRLLQELKYLDADIMCLQDVGSHYFDTLMKPTLAGLGYDATFIKQSNNVEVGEATFYRTSHFSIVHSKGSQLKDLVSKELGESGIDDDKKVSIEKYMNDSSVVLITQLKCGSSGKVLTVGNVHVAKSADKPDLQCIQVASAVKEIVTVAEGPDNAYIICGDFNIEPSTPVYQLTKEGYLNDSSMASLQALSNISLSDDTKAALVNLWWKGFQHTSTNLKSAYSTTLGQEPATSFPAPDRSHKFDYIWVSGNSLDTIGVLQTSEIEQPRVIPNNTFPSDHLSLKAVLLFK